MNHETKQCRSYCFTWHDYPEDCVERLRSLNYSYCVYGKEICPSTGRPHLQGYLEFPHSKRMTTCYKYCPGIKRIEANGSAKANYTYCTKDNKDIFVDGVQDPTIIKPGRKPIIQEGEPNAQGKRNDILEALKDIEKGKDEYTMFMDHPGPMCRYPKSMDRFKSLVDKKNRRAEGRRNLNVIVHYGVSRRGKSETARGSDPNYFEIGNSVTGYWWDGYDGEETVILDEFRADMPLSQLLRMLDGGICNVPIKCGMKMLNAKTIYLTSNTSPFDWYKGTDAKSRLALVNRYTSVKEFMDDGSSVERLPELQSAAQVLGNKEDDLKKFHASFGVQH